MGFMMSIVSTGTVILQSAINDFGYLIIAGHMSSDSLGFNQILDAWEAKGVEIVRINGII